MRFKTFLVLSLACAVLTVSALAGPPAICHPVELEEGAASLPWGSTPFDKNRGYRERDLTRDTVAVLDSARSVLVHMETLRRATLYADDNDAVAQDLIAALMARALDGEAAGAPSALAWLDAGYLAQCYHQMGIDAGERCGRERGVVGYAWVRRAIELRPDDPELEFAAAMVTALGRVPEHDAHVRRVETLTDKESLVRRNLDHHRREWAHHQ